VLLRLGVFLGVLGRERIAVCPASGAVVMPAELRDLAVAPDPAAIRALLRRLAVTSSTPGSTSPVAPRRRRSLGTARSIDPEQTLRIADLSLTGALLETFGEFPEYQRLDLELALGNGGRVRLRAEVVRIQHPQWGRVGGIGVRFLQFEDGSRAILERFLDAERERDTATA
jgi:hypothetical protein